MALPTPYARENINYDFGRAMYFPGDDNGQLFLPVTDHTFDFLTNQKFTIGGWLRMQDSDRINIIVQKKSNNVSGYYIWVSKNNGQWILTMQEAKGFTQESYFIPIDARDPFMWAITYDPADLSPFGDNFKILKFWLNGDILNREQHRLSAMNKNNLSSNNSSTFFLGGDYNLQNLLGWQDNVFYHQGVAYSPEQIAKTYYGREPAVIGVSAFWNFNTQVGNTILDVSGNGHILTMANNVELQDDIFGHGWTRDAY